jgi:hypothetical protein
VETLCPRARFLALRTDRPDTTGLCRLLRRRYGVSVMENPADAALADTDVYLLFDVWPEPFSLPVKPGAAVLALAGGQVNAPPGCLVARGARLAPPLRLREIWPWDADAEALLAALVSAGAVGLGEVVLEGLRESQGRRGDVSPLRRAPPSENFALDKSRRNPYTNV